MSSLKKTIHETALTDVDFLRARGASEEEIEKYRERKRKKFLQSLKTGKSS